MKTNTEKAPTGSISLLGRLQRFWQLSQKRRWSRWAVDLLILAVVFAGISAFQTRDLLSSGEMAPDFELRTLDNQLLSLEELKGKPVLLAFWAPWCGVCKVESPNISRVKQWVGQRATVLSVALEYPDRHAVERYVQEQNVDYPVLMGNQNTGSEYKLRAFPTVYFLDSQGRVKRTTTGYTTTLGLWLRLML